MQARPRVRGTARHGTAELDILGSLIQRAEVQERQAMPVR